MRIDVVTLFEKMVDTPLSESIAGRARRNKILKLGFSNPRDFAADSRGTVDDRPYGGGAGMIMMAEPVRRAVEKARRPGSFVVLLTPRGEKLDQETVKKLALKKHLVLICGRYEGVDARVAEYADMELSIGDYVLSGGEPAAVVVIDAVTRLLPGVLKKKEAALRESFNLGLLEEPQYTRPRAWRGREVPEVLLGGNHRLIENWKKEQSLAVTGERRPDLLKTAKKKKRLTGKRGLRRKIA